MYLYILQTNAAYIWLTHCVLVTPYGTLKLNIVSANGMSLALDSTTFSEPTMMFLIRPSGTNFIEIFLSFSVLTRVPSVTCDHHVTPNRFPYGFREWMFESTLAQLMAWHRHGVMPWTEPMIMTYCQFDSEEQTPIEFLSKCIHRPQNVGHFIQSTVC